MREVPLKSEPPLFALGGSRCGGGEALTGSFTIIALFTRATALPTARIPGDRLRVGWLNGFSFSTSRAEDAQGIPTQSHISPSILVYEENQSDSWIVVVLFHASPTPHLEPPFGKTHFILTP